ncbi:mobilisation protein (MobC) [Tranquillimonas rosea]|uniref:Mobilisation protein (MobC) n=1 Tax=Tranquillimonas rosea TaxID=641238 RepID=A0A1H9VIH6_9RHOB|nr:plasmid mobilization relaxosome protein MobC [Tranquillimonas rosea]SES21600.1 mobilisation protein (MobC) [Tranquillimonas rosea]
MKNPTDDFNKITNPQKPPEREPTFPVPFSLRLSFEERARLENEAAGLPVGAYIRQRLFRDKETPRQTRGKFPVKDHAALGRVLGALGQSRLANNLNQIARAVNTGSLPVTPETEEEIKQACSDVNAMRRDLLLALGLHESGTNAGTGPQLKP